MSDHRHRNVDMFLRSPQGFGQFLELTHLQLPHVVRNNLPGHATTAILTLDLEQQALLQVPRRDSGRIQTLHRLERSFHNRHREAALLGHLFHGGDQIAVFIQVTDDGLRRVPNLFVQNHQAQLRAEIIRQRLGRGKEGLK